MEAETVLIYRDRILPSSETFVLAQGEGLSRYRPFYTGSTRVPGIEVPRERSLFISDGSKIGRAREVLFKAFDLLAPSYLVQLKDAKPKLLHAHFGPDGVLGQTIAKALNVPLVVTFHGYDATMTEAALRDRSYVERKYLVRMKALTEHCTRLIAVSHFIKGKLVELGIPEQKIAVHYIGVDVDALSPRDLVREPVVLFVGRLVEKKGCAYLIKAMQKVQEQFPAAELVVIGDGPLRAQLEGTAQKALTRVRFLGAQPNSVVREWMNRCKVFCVPSITAESGDAEGFGIVFAEAQAMGAPVVSSVSGGIPEAVAHGETGFLLPEKDWQGLAASISLLFEDAALWLRMSTSAQRRVRQRFDLRKQCLALEEIYGEVLAEGMRRSAE